MSILITILYVILFALIILKSKFFRDDVINPKLLIGVFVLKCVCGMFLLWLYFNEGIGGDMYAFFQNGEKLHDVFKTDPTIFLKILFGIDNSGNNVLQHLNSLSLWFNNDVLANDNRSIIRLNSIISFFSFGYFPVHIIFFCFLSMTGLMSLYRVFKSFVPEKSLLIFIAVFLIPSVLFWTSGIFKESYLICVLGLFLFTINKLSIKKNSARYFIAPFLLFYFLCYIKIYFIITLIPALIVMVLSKQKSLNKTIGNSILVYVVIFSFLICLKYTDAHLDLFKVIANKQFNFIEYAKFSEAKSRIDIPVLDGTPISIIKNSPVAIWNVLARPYLWENKSVYWILISIENLLVITLIGLMLFKFKLNRKCMHLSAALLLFSISLFIVIGLTTPVLGSLVRYKSPALIFFLMFFVLNSTIDEKISFHKK